MSNFWNDTIWKGINDEVRKVAGVIRVAQKVFPTIILDNPSSIPDDTFDLQTFTIPEGLTKPFVEISAPFSLTPNQVAYESSLHTGLKLAKLRAAAMAQVEDMVLFQGKDAVLPVGFPQPRNLASAGAGLLGDVLAANVIDVPLLPASPPGVLYGVNTVNAVVKGIGQLNDQAQPGPFALILDFRVMADAYSVLGGTLTTTADLITPLVTGGIVGTAALGPYRGLLVSLGGEPTTLYMGVEATTAFTEKDSEDNHSFRVFERVQFDARDPRAFVELDFSEPAQAVVSKKVSRRKR